jgi:hypothetical protein
MWKYFRNGLVFGFLLEMMMVGTRIYENIIRSTTTKRLGKEVGLFRGQEGRK